MVACGAEVLAPAHGLFGAATGEDVSVFAALALSIVCAAGVLATQNKRRLGLKLREVRVTHRQQALPMTQRVAVRAPMLHSTPVFDAG